MWNVSVGLFLLGGWTRSKLTRTYSTFALERGKLYAKKVHAMHLLSIEMNLAQMGFCFRNDEAKSVLTAYYVRKTLVRSNIAL